MLREQLDLETHDSFEQARPSLFLEGKLLVIFLFSTLKSVKKMQNFVENVI